MQTCADLLPTGYEREANRVENAIILKMYIFSSLYFQYLNFLFFVAKFTIATIRIATREHLNKTNISVLKTIATDLGIDCKKKKKI